MKYLLVFIFTFFTVFTRSQTAVNFSAADCDGVIHDLYTELDEGKVIVLCWVMPCPTCVPASKSSYNKVSEFQTTHPGRVFFYMCDDYGTTICSTVESWASSNGMTLQPFMKVFSDSTIRMTDYGSTGMPKIVVVGGNSHSVYYNVISAVDVSELENSINQALAASSSETYSFSKSGYTVFPNPAEDFIIINSDKNDIISYSIRDLNGHFLLKSDGHINSKFTFADISVLKPGKYLIEINTSKGTDYKEFIKVM